MRFKIRFLTMQKAMRTVSEKKRCILYEERRIVYIFHVFGSTSNRVLEKFILSEDSIGDWGA